MASAGLPRDLRKRLDRIVGREAVLTEPGELLPFESDALTSHRATPAAVVFVRRTGQLIEVVSALRAAGMPFVPRGAGTGLSGGAVADGAVIIEMARMNRIVWIDADNRRARVQPGVVNTQLNAAVAAHGLMYAPDPSSQTACTLGGNVAENSGGPHCLKYGVTSNHILGLTIVTADAECIELSGPEGPGYDLVGLFVGSEGTLGICSEIEVRLVPQPAAVETLLAHFGGIDAASQAVSSIIAAGIVPAALEMIDRETLKAVEASVYAAGFPTDVAASLIVELDGPEAGLAGQARDVEAILSRHGARQVTRAASDEDRVRLWRARKSAFGAMGRLGSDLLVQDGTVPRSRLPRVLSRVYQVARKYDLTITNVFHAGDGNLHPNIPFDGRDPEMAERVRAASREIMEVCVDEGGTITGEHGVGIDKRIYMPLVYSEDDRRAMRWVKEVFDPAWLCNAGKIFEYESARSDGDRAVKPAAGRIEREDIATAIESRFGSDCLAPDPEAFPLNGEPPAAVATPGSIEELVEVMRLASGAGWVVVPAGHGTWPFPGNALRRADLVVSTRRLNGAVEHHPEDLLATVQAGTTLDQLGAVLAQANQWWPLDPLGGGSVGATIATGSAGPLAAGYGSPRDLLLGLTAVLADGRVIKAGGRVVKNVAGYDMVKLFAGSWGTLGVIVESHLRLHARPQADATRVFAGESGLQLAALAAELCSGRELAPVAAEILSPDAAAALGARSGAWLLAVRWMGYESTVAAATDAAAAAADRIGPSRADTVEGLWERLGSIEDRVEPVLAVRVEVPIRAGREMIGLAAPFAGGVTPALVASPLTGRIWALVSESSYVAGPGDKVWSLRVSDYRQAAVSSGGSLRIERAPESLLEFIDAWGEGGRALRLHQGLKLRFDPNGTLKPGFYVGHL